jgi:hypothetical protein
MQMVSYHIARFGFRYVATHPSCMGCWFILVVCQDSKYHQTSSIYALVHHIVCSLSEEASNIAFPDLELLNEMHELLWKMLIHRAQKDARLSSNSITEFATISCDLR